MRPIRVLFTNNALGPRGGSETYIRDVAIALVRQGHRPAAFSLVHGDVAVELRNATVPVIDDITRLGEPPDVIHGHHHLETLIAALAFPDAPIVNFCHGWIPWEEMPLHHPSVRRYVAVDEVCADRLIREEGLAPGQVDLLLNFVDPARFARRAPLPRRPARALVLSNAARASGYAGVIRAACEAAGVTLDIVGAAAGNPTDVPEQLLAGYDLVFAKGRSALEALAVGCATIVADAAGAGPLVTPDNYEGLRRRNFGIRELRHAHDVEWYRDQIATYDAERCGQVTERVRVDADLDAAVARLLDIYQAAMAAPPGPGDASRAAAIHCSRIAVPLKQAYRSNQRAAWLERELDVAQEHHARTVAQADAENRALRAGVDGLLADLACFHAEHRDSQAQHALETHALHDRLAVLAEERSQGDESSRATARQLAAALQQVEALQRQVAEFRSLPSLRLRDALLRTPLVGSAIQRMARRLMAHG